MPSASTGDKILDAALTLFAVRGCDCVGVDLIAGTIGIRGPSLYRYFDSKEQLLAAVLDNAEKYYNENYAPDGTLPGSADEFAQTALARIGREMNDPYLIKVRRLLRAEQYRSARIASLADRIGSAAAEEEYARSFAGMMASGVLKGGDPAVLALEFTSPVTLLTGLSDREPERREELFARIAAHVTAFIAAYRADTEAGT